MYCYKCGAQVKDDSSYCSYCGNHLAKDATQNDATTAKKVVNPYQPESKEPSPNPYAQIFAKPIQEDLAPAHTQSKSKPNPFAFISASIMSTMLLFYFFPWFYIDDKSVGLFIHYVGRLPLVYPDDTAVILFLIFLFIAMGLMIPGIIIALNRKNHVPMVFAITSSVSINLSMLFFIFTEEAWTIGVSIFPILIWLLSFVNIVFAIFAKRR